MNIVLFGPPGAGKGTQADNLVREFNFFKISTGDLLREEIEKKSLLGKRIKLLIDDGLLVADDIIDNLIEKILNNPNYKNKLIFDGYPRNINQAKKLDILLNKYNQKIHKVFSLDIDETNVIKRILGREVCSKCNLTFNKFFNKPTSLNHKCDPKFLITRSDDNEIIVKKRFVTYVNQTLPILNYYGNQKLLVKIDGMQEINVIYKEIRQIIASLNT